MSLNEKYTPEELNSIPPFTGFHHNKIKDEIIEKAAQVIKGRCDDLIGGKYDNLIFKKATKESYDGTELNPFLLDEVFHSKIPYYDADPIHLNHNDEVSPFGKINLWDFSGGMNKDSEINKIPECNYKFT